MFSRWWRLYYDRKISVSTIKNFDIHVMIDKFCSANDLLKFFSHLIKRLSDHHSKFWHLCNDQGQPQGMGCPKLSRF
jgi:hypothetical protein